MMRGHSEITLVLRQDVEIRQDADQSLSLSWPEGKLHLNRPKPGLTQAINQLATGASESSLRSMVMSRDGGLGLVNWQRLIRQLDLARVLERRIRSDDRALATLFVHSEHFRFEDIPVDLKQRYIVSRFAHLRRIETDWLLTSPCGYASIRIASEIFPVVALLNQPMSLSEVVESSAKVPESSLRLFFKFLLNAQIVSPANEDGVSAEDSDEVKQQWEFHDLVFHASSQHGRALGKLGGQLRFFHSLPPQPALKAPRSSQAIALATPDTQALIHSEPTLFDVMESRRSHWEYDEALPMSLTQLGVLLYRVARVQGSLDATLAYGEDEMAFPLTHRPYPSGGSLYPLELYCAVRHCNGLSPGLYHYEPSQHALHHAADFDDKVESLLVEGSAGGDGINPPQVLLLIAARFQRTMWKYSGVAYTLLLKECGVLYQSLYLVATAMDLAPCALGGCHPDLFSVSAETDYLAEGCIGAFALGSRAVHKP